MHRRSVTCTHLCHNVVSTSDPFMCTRHVATIADATARQVCLVTIAGTGTHLRSVTLFCAAHKDANTFVP